MNAHQEFDRSADRSDRRERATVGRARGGDVRVAALWATLNRATDAGVPTLTARQALYDIERELHGSGDAGRAD